MSRQWRRRTVFAVLFASAVGVVAPTAIAGEHLRSQVHTALWYYWPQRWVDYYIQDTRGQALNVGPGAALTSDDIQRAAAEGFAAWSQQSCTDIQFYYRGNVATRESNLNSESINGYNTIIFRYDDWLMNTACNDAIACTTVVTKRAAGEILDADIDLNLQEYEFVLNPIEGSAAFDIQSVLVHEIGHMIGFDHTQPEFSDAVMWPYADWGEQGMRRVLTQDDVDTLCETYPAGQCPVINDHRQQMCPAAELGGCMCATAPQDEGAAGAAAVLGALFVLGLLALRRPRG